MLWVKIHKHSLLTLPSIYSTFCSKDVSCSLIFAILDLHDMSKSLRNSAIFFIPWETISMNSLFSQSCWICCWTSELILRLRLGKNSTCFLQEDSRMWKINSTGLNNQRKIFSFETHEHFNIGSKLLWEKQTWPPKLIFYALVEERLSIWSSGPSVHLIGNLFTQWNTTDICQLDNVENIPPLYARFNCWWQTDRRFHWTAF